MRSKLVPASLALLALAPSILAGEVRLVTPTGPFTTIQSAIDASADYDTVLVIPKPGDQTYGSFVVHAKSIAIIGSTARRQLTVARVLGECVVDDTPGGGLVLLGRLALFGGAPGASALRTEDNSGPVWLESCGFRGSIGADLVTGPAVRTQNDADVRFVACTSSGGSLSFAPGGAIDPPAPLPAVSMLGSVVRLIGSTLIGGAGYSPFDPDPYDGTPGGDGGIGLRIEDGIVLSVGSTIRGGKGGDGGYDEDWIVCPDEGGPGGSGGTGAVVVSVSGPADLRTRGGLIAGGSPGYGGPSACGEPGPTGSYGAAVVTIGGAWTQLTGVPRWIEGTPFVVENSAAPIKVIGSAGDQVFLQFSEITAPQQPGHWPVSPTNQHAGLYLGTIPASGTLDASLPIGNLPLGTESIWLELRPRFIDTSGTAYYGNGFVIVVVDSSVGS